MTPIGVIRCQRVNIVTLIFRVVEIYSSNVTLICLQIIVYVNARILLHTHTHFSKD